MNRTKRYVAAEVMQNASLKLVAAQHDLWRATHIFKEGLTEKELVLLEKKAAEMIAIQHLYARMAHRLRQSGRCT